jgi:uncharacterized protein YwgA
MTQFQIALYKYLKEMGYDFKDYSNNKSMRILFQKYCYIIKKFFSLSTGRYNQYINGPYNPTLANEGYEIIEDIYSFENLNDSDFADLLNQQTREKIAKIKDAINNNLNGIEEVEFLELYTTYDYLRKEYSFSGESLKNKLMKLKKSLFEDIQRKHNINFDQIFSYLENLDYTFCKI